ncbi:MAG TPA: ABC transporter permease [Terriglobia bacterium]|nr:ABC transporter permease [Terriglobia bacterium]
MFEKLFGRKRNDRDFKTEIEAHIQMEAARLREQGLSEQEAHHAACRAFGNVTKTQERFYEFRRWLFWDNLARDLRFALRMLRKSPGFTTVAILTLALGIGANTAIFSFVNALLLRTLPVDRPDQLVMLDPTDIHDGSLGFSYPLFKAMRDENKTLDGLFVRTGGAINVSVDGQAEMTPGGAEYVSGGYFSTLGVTAIAGRAFTADEDKVPGQNPVAVISYGYWKRRFALSPSVIGKTVHLNGFPFTIIGVTPPRFFGIRSGGAPDITVPITMYPQLNPGNTWLSNPGSWWLDAMGRMKPGVSAAQATADLSAVFQHYAAGIGLRTEGMSFRLEPGAWGLSPRSKTSAWAGMILLMALVSLVLLITCTNLANLLLARGAARQKEIAVRLALGAGRGRLIRQLVTESLLLALLGGAAGLLLAFWGTQFLLKIVPAGVSLDLSPDARTLIYAGGISLLVGLLFGLMPAWRTTQTSSTQWFQRECRQAAPGPRGNRLGNGLVISQVMLSMVLLFVAGLFTHSFQELLSVDLGFRPDHVLVFSVDPTLIGYQGSRLSNLYKDLLQHAETVPGVLAVSMSRHGLVTRGGWRNSISVPGYASRPGEDISSNFDTVGPNFFQTAGIPILVGRDFGERDNEAAPKVAVVNETFARQFFGHEHGVQEAIGRTIGLGVNQNLGQFEIVGVVKDSKQSHVDEPPLTVVYFSFLQLPASLQGEMTLEVRTAGEPGAMTRAIRRELLAVEKNLPVYGVKTLTQQVQESLMEPRMIAWLASLFGLLALLLASVGLYGVIAYSTVRRTPEIGIRMALGARRWEVMQLVLREALRLTAIGAVIGLALAFAAGRAISSMLYGVSAGDPLTILGASLLMFSAAAMASFLPAWRASRVDPMVALRYE